MLKEEVEPFSLPSDVENNPEQRLTTNSLLAELEENRQKPFLRRNLSPLSKGGIRSSIFTLFSTTVGAGILAIPKVFSYYGIIGGMFCLLFFAIICSLAQHAVMDLMYHTKAK